MRLKYGVNPQQVFANAEPVGDATPITVISGSPSYINLLDALNAWQLVREARAAIGKPAATSFKHVSPAGAAVAGPLDEAAASIYGLRESDLTPSALAYVRAREADPKSSYGDLAALSEPVDVVTAEFLKGVVSDGVIAPGYDPGVVGILAAKKGGRFLVIEADPSFEPPPSEAREVFGLRLAQDTEQASVSLAHLEHVVCGKLSDGAKEDLLLGMVTLRYTQSNSVGYALNGLMIGIGAGQQSRIDCTKLAGAKADVWHLRRHPKTLALAFMPGVKRQDRINWRVRYIEGDLTPHEQAAFTEALEELAEPLTDEERKEWRAGLDGVSLVSDGYIPFRDNIDHAQRHGVRFVADPGGSIRGDEVEAACREYGITLVRTGLRLFHH
jgi:phosphoribosylaminoimidazolecarboxamide formyltransferase/IMP cyclohydrolase